MTRLSLPLVLIALTLLPLGAHAQNIPNSACITGVEIALVLPSGSSDIFDIAVWYLDDYVAHVGGDPDPLAFYYYTTQRETCAWLAETNFNPTPPVPLPTDDRIAYLPPNAPYVVDIQHRSSSAGVTFTYALCNTGTPIHPDETVYDPLADGFYCPYEDNAPNQTHQDTDIQWTGSELLIRPQNVDFGEGDGVSEALAAEFGASFADDWVLPYDYDAVCQALANDGDTNSTCFAGETGADFFISPQIGYNYTFAPNDVDLRAAWDWTWTDAAVQTVRLQPGKKLIVEGDLYIEDVTLTKAGTGDWDGILVADGSLTTESGTVVEYADAGIDVYSPGVAYIDDTTIRENYRGLRVRSTASVTNSTIEDNRWGIYTGYLECSGATCSCASGCRSTLDVTDTHVLDNYYGIFARNVETEITGTEVLDSDSYGFYLWNGDTNDFRFNDLKRNGYQGAHVRDNGSLTLEGPSAESGFDCFTDNTDDEIWLDENAYFFAGYGTRGGDNSIFDDDLATGAYLIYREPPSGFSAPSVVAQETYWGTGGGSTAWCL